MLPCINHIPTNDIQEAKTKEVHDDYLPKLMGMFERLAVTNNTGWIWGGKVIDHNAQYQRTLLTISHSDFMHRHDNESVHA